MKRKKIGKINIKSEQGFTMTDLIIAILVFTMLTGIIGTIMINVYKTNIQLKVSADATAYAIHILEDIDKISYDEVQESLANEYVSKFSIPSAYTVNLEVTNYNEGTDKEDLIKKVKLDISYNLQNKTQKVTINKLKIKEIP